MTTENLVKGTLKQYGKIPSVKIKIGNEKFYVPLEENDFVEVKNEKDETVLSGVFAEKKSEFVQIGLGMYVHVKRENPTIIDEYLEAKHSPAERKNELLELHLN